MKKTSKNSRVILSKSLSPHSKKNQHNNHFTPLTKQSFYKPKNNSNNFIHNLKRKQRKTQTIKRHRKNPTHTHQTASTKEKSKILREQQSEKQNWKQNLAEKVVHNQRYPSIKDKSLQCLEEIKELSNKSITEISSYSFLRNALNTKTQQPLCFLKGLHRIAIVDWIFLIGSELLLKRETVQLSIHYIDSYLQAQVMHHKLYCLAAGSLLLSVKQQQRHNQQLLIETFTKSCNMELKREEIIEMEKQIILKLKFKLKSNTLAFWMDYFSSKWDHFNNSKVATQFEQSLILNRSQKILVYLRNSEGYSYKYYREMCQLSDIIIYSSQNSKFQKCKLALACIYHVVRIQSQSVIHSTNLWDEYFKGFLKKASPIFRDPHRFNQIFNEFLTQLCQFQITQIITQIKYVSSFLDLPFSYCIDQRAYNQSDSYEQFIILMTYSSRMKQYAKSKLITTK